MIAKRRFALDQNFPVPIVNALRNFVKVAELVSIRDIDPNFPRMSDWELLVALSKERNPWDGLISNDEDMLNLSREMAILHTTKMTLILTCGQGIIPFARRVYCSRISRQPASTCRKHQPRRSGN